MIKRIVVVGGGFAGWCTTACLQLHVPGIEITQIESPVIPRLRVGETLSFSAPGWFQNLIGLPDEKELMRQTGSIYKLGVHNVNFFNNNESIAHGHVNNFSIDSLHLPVNERKHCHGADNAFGIYEAWLQINQHNPNRNAQQLFDEIYDSSHFSMNPILPFDQDNRMILESSHTYHFDAEEMVGYLKNVVLSRSSNCKVTHIVANVVNLEQNNDGSIAAVILDNQEKITSDLYIDCSGFGRVLAKRTHQGLWTDYHGHNNSAWVCPTKYADPAKEMVNSTKIIGEDHGWRFLVNLYHRQGNGYVFNDNLSDREKIGGTLDQITAGQQLVAPRLINWAPGAYQQPWFKNCLVLGVAQAFFDPWDAPAFTEHIMNLQALLEAIPTLNNENANVDKIKKYYNQASSSRSEERRIRYLVAHGLSSRSGPYWDHVRQLSKQENIITEFEKMFAPNTLGNLNVYGMGPMNMYLKLIILNGIDISKWILPEFSEQQLALAKNYFLTQKIKNQKIRNRSWPNSYEWFKENLFGGATSQEIYEEFSHRY